MSNCYNYKQQKHRQINNNKQQAKSIILRTRLYSIIYVQLLQWLHGKQQQQHGYKFEDFRSMDLTKNAPDTDPKLLGYLKM